MLNTVGTAEPFIELYVMRARRELHDGALSVGMLAVVSGDLVRIEECVRAQNE